MRNVRMWLSLAVISVVAILILNNGDRVIPGDSFDGLGSYVVLGLLAFAFLRFVRVSTNGYFARPVLGWRFIVAIGLCVNLIVVQLKGEPFHAISVGHWVRGVSFLLAVGFAEEILSRGIVFGVLQNQGLAVAVFGSSLMFGLMHLNVYIGNWDSWQAYWHVMSALSFGVFACGLMLVTKSIWVPIIFHAISDAGLLFEKAPTKAEEAYRVSIDFWRGVVHPLPAFLTFVIPGVILLWIHVGAPFPGWAKRLALRWKLIEVDPPKIALVGEN